MRAVILVCLLLPLTAPAAIPWSAVPRQPDAWHATAEARAIADTVLLYQTPSGGWPKNRDMTRRPALTLPADGRNHTDITAPTIDNNATYTQIRFLVRVNAAHSNPRYDAAVRRGLDYLFTAQYPNGGWPQFYPLLPGYYTHITFNDDAMVGVLELLRDVAERRAPFEKVEAAVRDRAATAVQQGIACILRCQIVVNGTKTAWCAQHDERTLAPAPARKYEHISLSGSESVGIVRFLMGVDQPSPEIIAAIRSAVTWLEKVKLTGLRVELIPAPDLPHGEDKRVVADPAAPPLWARFYEIGTNRPIFSGRDSIVRYTLAEVEAERRAGYSWYVDAPRKLLDRDYPVWAKKWLP